MQHTNPSLSFICPSPRAFLSNARGAFGEGGNPVFVLLDVPPGAYLPADPISYFTMERYEADKEEARKAMQLDSNELNYTDQLTA